LLGAIFSIILDFAINFFYKVSVHTTAAGIMPGNIVLIMLFGESIPNFILLMIILLAALVGVVRWLLGSHTIGQLILGYLIGFTMQIFAYLILRFS
jgi:hypothetical protein